MTTLSKPRQTTLEWVLQGRVFDIAAPQGVTHSAIRWARDEGYIIALNDEGEMAYEITEEGRKLLEEQAG